MKIESSDKTMAICMIGTFAIGLWCGVVWMAGEAKSNAIKQSCAHYDSKTGEFKWGQP